MALKGRADIDSSSKIQQVIIQVSHVRKPQKCVSSSKKNTCNIFMLTYAFLFFANSFCSNLNPHGGNLQN